MRIKVTLDREGDGRWIAEVPALCVLVYGVTRDAAYVRAKAAALCQLEAS